MRASCGGPAAAADAARREGIAKPLGGGRGVMYILAGPESEESGGVRPFFGG